MSGFGSNHQNQHSFSNQNYQNQHSNNSQNQQNQYSNNNQNSENPSPSKEFAIAVGPAQEEDIASILDIIRIKILTKFDADYEYSNNPNFNYFTFFVNEQKLKITITKLKSIEYRRNTVFISPSEYPIDNIYIDYVESIFPQCLTGTFLDLSDIKTKSQPNMLHDGDVGIDINSDYSSLPFLLFLCSLKCQVLLRDVQYISFDNNFLTNPRHLSYFSAFFPSLCKISLTGSVFDHEEENAQKPNNKKKPKQDNKNEIKFQLDNLARQNVIVSFDQPMSHYNFEDKKKRKNYFGNPGFSQPDPFPDETQPLDDIVVLETIKYNPEKERRDRMLKEMKQNQRYKIHANYFPTDDFIDKFIEYSRNSIQSACLFYAANSFFSITVDKCPPNSPMAFYSQFSTNRLNSQFVFQQPFGVRSVIDAQLEVFGPQFDSIVSSINQFKYNFRYAIIIHGVFNGIDDTPLAFDRSLMVVENDSNIGFEIVNDHIFIRKSRDI